MSANVRTWADGYGVWHAKVRKAIPHARDRACTAIIAELAQREPPTFDPSSVSVLMHDIQGEWIHYVEMPAR